MNSNSTPIRLQFPPIQPERKLYNTLTMLGYLLGIVSPDSRWVAHVKQLLAAHPPARPAEMGFPAGWERCPAWQGGRP